MDKEIVARLHASFEAMVQKLPHDAGHETHAGRPLADFLPTITIKAKDFANEITNFNVKQNDMCTETRITGEHVEDNEEVRRLLVDRGIVPERLPPGEDVKKVERRLATEQKTLPKQVKGLEGPSTEEDAR